MMRGITFIDLETGARILHTGDDLGLIMSAKVIGMPKPRYSLVDMPDRDGSLDQTEVIRGRVSYGNRPLSFSFTCTAPQTEWANILYQIGYAHGRLLGIIDPDFPNYHFIARCTVKEPTYKGSAIMFIDVEADAQPYRLWNENGGYVSQKMPVVEGNIVNLEVHHMAVVPSITVSADMTIAFGDFSIALTAGNTYRIPEITLDINHNKIDIVSGSGEITFTYLLGVL